MELFIVLLVVAIGIAIVYKMMFKDEPTYTTSTPTTTETKESETTAVINKSGAVTDNVLDVNKDGKVDVKDAKEVVKRTRTRVKKALDQDGDGKVTTKDAKIAATKAKAKTKEVVAKTRGRKSVK